MTTKEWQTVKHFSITEKWGNHYKMDYRLIWLLDMLRKELDKPIIIHCGYGEDGHAPNSYHRRGQAVDFRVQGAELYTVWFIIDKLWWMGGAGIYPHWNTPGFHLDIGRCRRWYRDKQGQYFNIVDGVIQE